MYFPPADFFFVHSQNSGIDPSGGLSHASPISIYYYTARGYFISLTNNPCQSCGRYDPTRHFIALSSNSKFQHGAALLLPTTWMARLEHWQLNILSLCRLVSCHMCQNASSTFPGNSDNDIYADITGIRLPLIWRWRRQMTRLVVSYLSQTTTPIVTFIVITLACDSSLVTVYILMSLCVPFAAKFATQASLTMFIPNYVHSYNFLYSSCLCVLSFFVLLYYACWRFLYHSWCFFFWKAKK